jgi:CheY-like chemotaxis protein
VSDTGKGIAPELLPRIFEPFHQVESASTRLHGGLGLGLAIVNQLVTLHHGRVTVDSPGVGRGATFTVELPAAGTGHAGPPGDTGTPQAWPSLAGVRVLAVDDDADARHVVSAVLETCGAKTAMVGSVAEALDAFGRTEFDVLVADIAMPGQDGYDLIGQVRAREAAGRRIPAVALTAFARREDAARALATGYDAHLAKPVEPRRLVEAVATLVRRTP